MLEHIDDIPECLKLFIGFLIFPTITNRKNRELILRNARDEHPILSLFSQTHATPSSLYSCEITLGRMVRVTAIRKQDLPRPDDQDFQGSSFPRVSKDSGT